MNINELTDRLDRISKQSEDLNKSFNNTNNLIKMKKLEIYFYDKHKNIFEGTYLEDKKQIIELYKLFIFYGMLEYVLNNIY
tara:strand:+ start:737 stop:979 length:243 start_codon:yes stop_codon:yes gene_type:complete